MSERDEHFMQLALNEGQKALDENILPVGAVLVYQNHVVGKTHKSMGSYELEHAETNLLRDAFSGQHPYGKKAKRNMAIYTTLEPCMMCYGTMRHCNIGKVVYAMEDPYGGALHCMKPNCCVPARHHDKPLVMTGGVLREKARCMFLHFMATTQESFWKNGGGKELQEALAAERSVYE